MINATAKLNKVFETVIESCNIIKDEINGNLRHLVFKIEGKTFVVDQQDESTFAICQCWVDKSGYVNYGTTQKFGKTIRVIESFLGSRL